MIDLFKNVIQKVYIKAIVICPDLIGDIPDQYRMRELYTRLVEKDLGWFYYVPDRFKTQKMYDEYFDNVVCRD